MIFAILALLLGANVIRATLLVPTFGLDFHVYYLAAHAGWAQGWSHITDPSYVWQAGRRLHPVTLPLRNPPFIIWLMAPLALLPEPLGLRIWVSVSVLITLTAFAWVGGPLKREPLYWMTIAGLYPIVYMLFLGQNSPVVVFAAGLCWFLIRSDRDLLAGLALGLGLTKPNLIILVPVAMLIGGRWRVTLGFTAAAVMIAIHGLLTLGWENSQLFLNLIFRESTTEVAYTMQFLVPNQALLTGLRGLAIATVIVAAKRLGTRHPAELLVVGIIGSAVIATFWHLPDFAIVDLGIVLLLAERWNRTIWVFALISVELSSPLTSGLVVIPAAVQVAGWVLLEWSLLAVLTLTQPKLNSVPPHFTQA